MFPDIAMAASARDWPDRFHRFLLDHGGGRVVDRVMSADQANMTGFDVLLIDDVCSFLTPRLVAILKESGVEVIGVYLPEDGSDAKRRLLECGISDVIETEATPEEFLAKVHATLAHRLETPVPDVPISSPAFRLAVTGPCEGVGITEVAVGIGLSLSSHLDTVLVDLDPSWPSVAQRLDLPLHPNLRTALDHSLHQIDRLDESWHRIDGLSIIGGRADGGSGPDISRADSLMLLDALSGRFQVVVADLGPLDEPSWGIAREFDSLVVVGSADPVGVGRLIKVAQTVVDRHTRGSVVAVVNRVGPGGFRRNEVVEELQRLLPDVPSVTLPNDPKLEQAAWDGSVISKSPFSRAVGEMSAVVVRSLT
jgi:MinD-like ATPase involved in chromosome partitioning or flagellar assembly